MAHLQYIPGDPRLVDQLVYELKSKGIFDQFRKDCIADVDTRPAYQNLRQRVESSVSTFLARQCWQPDLNKNQLREKLRKHILDGNYLEQGVERIVDQVVNPKVASVFIPQVEDLVCNYLGITRKKTVPVPETSNEKVGKNNLLPTDLEAVSPGSVNDDKHEELDIPGVDKETNMDVDQEEKVKEEIKEDTNEVNKVKTDAQDTQMSGISEPILIDSSSSMDMSCIPLPAEEIKLENIPAPENSPPKILRVELDRIKLPEEPNVSTDAYLSIPLPEETYKSDKEHYFKPVNSDDDSSSDSSLIRNMSPLTPIRNFNNENSCDAQQAFDNDSNGDRKSEKKEVIEPNTFRFTIETKNEDSIDEIKPDKKDTDQANLSYQFNNQVNINAFNTPMYDDSSNSNLLHIDYESDANSKLNLENKPSEVDQNSNESKKDRKQDEKKSSHRSSHHKDSHRHSSTKDRRSDSKQSSSRDSRSDKKSSKDDHKSTSKSSNKEKSSDKSDKKESRDSSKHRSSHKSSSSHKDSKSHRRSSSSQRHSSSKHSDEKKSSSSSQRDKEKSSKDDKNSKEKSSKDSKSNSSSHRSDKDRKSSSSKSKHDDKDKKKDKKETDDHYSASGRGSHSRRSTDRDSNDGSTSSKGSHNPSSAKSLDSKKESKSSTSKSDSTSTSGESPSPSDKDHLINEMKKSAAIPQNKPIIRVDNHLEVPILSPPRLPFVPDVTLRKPKIAANLEEARKMMKMRKFLDEEQKRMNQEAALLLEFQANVRPSMSQVYSSIPGPELEFACINTPSEMVIDESHKQSENKGTEDNIEARNDSITYILNAAQQVESIEVTDETTSQEIVTSNVTDETVTQTIEISNIKTKNQPMIVEKETEEEVSKTDKATVHIEKSIDTEENIVEHTPIEDKYIEIIRIVTPDIEDDESQQAIEQVIVIKESENDESQQAVTESKESEDDESQKVVIESNESEDDEIQQAVIETKESETIKENNPVEDKDVKDKVIVIEDDIEMKLSLLHEKSEYSVQVTVEEVSLSDTEDKAETIKKLESLPGMFDEEIPFEYFAEHEKYKAEIDRDTFSKFLKAFINKYTEKMHLINCETYEQNIVKDVLKKLGTYEVVNYYKNGHLKVNNTAKNIVRNVNVSSEITLPVESNTSEYQSSRFLFSPVKSECSFELSSDYDAKLEEMVSKTSRKEIMEIILGNVEESANDIEMPTIDYCNESNIESDTENTVKRKYCEVESSENNNRQVLTPNKIRKSSESEQITSTTEETEETSNNNVSLNTTSVRSKYLGRARRVGLPRPRRTNLPNSPSSDKSIENYEQNTPVTQTPNGKMKTPRNKVQRYDTSDLYKPKLHYLSRRNNIS